MLVLDKVGCTNNDGLLFNPVSTAIPESSHIYLRGPNGIGKTSMLKTISLLKPIDVGQVFWNNTDVTSIKSVYKKHLHYVGHNHFFVPYITIMDNLKYVLGIYGEKYDEDLALSIIFKLMLQDFLDTPYSKLSAGCKQKLAILVLLLRKDVKIWLLDEPFSNLDKNTSEFLFGVSEDFVYGKRGIIIESTHDYISPHKDVVTLVPVKETVLND